MTRTVSALDRLFAAELAEQLAEIDEMIAEHTDKARHHEAEAADIVRCTATPLRERHIEPDPRGAREWRRRTLDANFERLIVADLLARRMRLLARGAKRGVCAKRSS